MTVNQINAELMKLVRICDQIDLTKEDTKIDDIRKMSSKPISEIDKLTGEKEFNEENLESAIGVLKHAKSKVAAYDSNIDKAKRNQYIRDGKASEANDVQQKIEAKKDVQNEIIEKYTELTRKKAVIEQYAEQFSMDELMDREDAKIEEYEENIKDNEDFVKSANRFVRNEIQENLNKISNCAKFEKALNEIDKLIKQKERIEADKSKYTGEMLKVANEEIKSCEKNIEEKCTELGTLSFGKIKLDAKTVKSADITSEKTKIKTEKDKEGKEIISKIKGMDTQIYSEHFKNEMESKVPDGTDPEKIESIFSKAINMKKADNINLRGNIKIASNNLKEMEIAEKSRASSNNTRPGKVWTPSEDEIYERLTEEEKALSDELALTTVPQNRKEERKAKKEFCRQYLEDKGLKTKGIRGWFNVRFNKGARSAWEDRLDQIDDYENRREDIIEELRQERRNKIAEINQRQDEKKNKFRSSLIHHVMKADKATLEEYEDKASQGEYGELTNQAYNDIEKDSGR